MKLEQGTFVAHREEPSIRGKVLCAAGDGFYYVAVGSTVYSVSQDFITVTDRKSRLSEEDRIRFAKYLNVGAEKDREGSSLNGYSLALTQRPISGDKSLLYADSELNVHRSSYPNKYLIITKNVRIGNRINKETATFKDYIMREGDEPQFHLDLSGMNDAIKALGKVRGEKVYAALRNV